MRRFCDDRRMCSLVNSVYLVGEGGFQPAWSIPSVFSYLYYGRQVRQWIRFHGYGYYKQATTAATNQDTVIIIVTSSRLDPTPPPHQPPPPEERRLPTHSLPLRFYFSSATKHADTLFHLEDRRMDCRRHCVLCSWQMRHGWRKFHCVKATLVLFSCILRTTD